MQYKPLESAINYFIGLYRSAKDATQKFGNSLMPSGLELAIAGVPNSVLNRQPETPDKLQGYFFVDYGVKSVNPQGNGKVIVTRSDGRTIPLDPKRVKKEGMEEGYVASVLGNNGIHDKGAIRRVAKVLREYH